jgi:putative transposase of IS4/5 family DUF4096
VALTVPEVRRLLHAVAEPLARRAARLHWSRWRRAHQATAARCHAARRARQHPPPADRGPVVVAVPGTPLLTDACWARAAPLLPANRRRGGQWQEHRRVLGGILWVMHTGAPWRELPTHFGSWQTAHSRYQRWRRDGTWAGILTALQQPALGPAPT